MRRTLLAALAVTVTLPAADRATAQFTCRGYREGRCRASWFTQAGYYYRLDRDIGGVHLFTWEIGPQMALLERNVTLGVTAWLAADFDNNARMGGKFRATRPAGPADLDVGIGLFLIDLNDNVPSLVAHAELIPKKQRTSSGLSVYSPDAVTRIRFIEQAQDLGFSLKEAEDLLALRIPTDTIRRTVDREAPTKIALADQGIHEFESSRAVFEELASACASCKLTSDYPVLVALDDQHVACHNTLPFTTWTFPW